MSFVYSWPNQPAIKGKLRNREAALLAVIKTPKQAEIINEKIATLLQ